MEPAEAEEQVEAAAWTRAPPGAVAAQALEHRAARPVRESPEVLQAAEPRAARAALEQREVPREAPQREVPEEAERAAAQVVQARALVPEQPVAPPARAAAALVALVALVHPAEAGAQVKVAAGPVRRAALPERAAAMREHRVAHLVAVSNKLVAHARRRADRSDRPRSHLVSLQR